MDANPPLTTTVAAPGRIVLAISGDLSKDRLSALRAAVVEARDTIERERASTGTNVRILLDMSAFSGTYDVEAMELFTMLAEHDKNVVAKTAAFGGPATATMAGEIVSALANRDNIRFFPTKEEADAWLAQ